MNTPVRKVVIVGEGAGAWLSALTLQRSFGKTGIDVELVELPSSLRPEDGWATLPSQRAFHHLLGLDETRLLRAASGVLSLGQRFSNWSGPEAPFLHAYDTQGASLNQVGFYQYWLRARANGLDVPLEAFSLGAMAAAQGRFVVFNENTQAFSKATYGYNLSAIGYLKAIARVALHEGLQHTPAGLASVQHEGGRIVSITLKNGETRTADLFVDASGAAARLLRHLEPRGNFEDWQQWLPCDRTVVASANRLEPVPAFNQVSAFRSGWLGIYPLADRTLLLGRYASDYADSAEVAQTLSALSGLRIEGDAFTDTWTAGGRKAHWIGNCVAVGDAAVRPDPVDAAALHLLQTGLSWLVSLFPVDRGDMPEASVYNEKMTEQTTGVRDFQAAHFKLNRRFGEPMWDAVREQAPPQSLARKLALFEARGLVSMNDNESFQEENWTAILNGHGLSPRHWDPLVDSVPEAEQIAHFQGMLKFIAAEVQAMPTLQSHLEMNAPQAESDYIFG